METTQFSLASLDFNKLEAFVELMFLAAYADGVIQDEERALFREQIIVGTEGSVRPELVDAMMGQIERSLAHEGREERFASIRRRVPDARVRQAGLALAARVIFADGKLKVDEIAFMMRAASALELDPEVAGKVIRDAHDKKE